MSHIFIYVFVTATLCQPTVAGRQRRQVFAQGSQLPGGGFTGSVGYRVSPTPDHTVTGFGSLSGPQDVSNTKIPFTIGGGVDWTAPRGELSAGTTHTFGGSTGVTFGGSGTLYKDQDHSVKLFGSRAHTFNEHSDHASTTFGVGYELAKGAVVSVSDTIHTDHSNRAAITASIPLHKTDDMDVKLNLQGQVDFKKNYEPTGQGGVSLHINY